MRLQIVLRYVGIIILLNAVFLLVSAIISFFNNDTAFLPLAYTCLVSILFGVFLFIFVPATESISSKEGLAIIVSSWLLSCLIGMVPYVLWGGEFTFTNAWFESVSGFTTTGSTILVDIEALPLGLLFWRSVTHWIGGVGIIIFALSVAPSIGKVGMVLYRSEISPLAADFRHQTKRMLQIIMSVYVGLTVLETIALLFCGMGLFDAVTHSFATIATGGFSPKNLSIAHYESVTIEIVVMVFMVLSGINFGLLFVTILGKFRTLIKSTVVRFYLGALAVGIFIITLNIHGSLFEGWWDALRYAMFQLLSIGTSTGFATTDTNTWPYLSKLVILFFTLLCACSGSTSGGIKVDRLVLLWNALLKRIKLAQHPHAVVKPKIDGVSIDGDILEASLLYIIIYIGIVFVSTVIVSGLGVDIMTSFSASAAAMGNVGPGFGLVGSASNFSGIPEVGKLVLTGDMLLGRLEVFGILLFFFMKFWK